MDPGGEYMDALDLALRTDRGLSVERLGLRGVEPIIVGGPAFGVATDSGWVDGSIVDVVARTGDADGGVRLACLSGGLRVAWELRADADGPVVEVLTTVTNEGDERTVVRRLDTVVLDVAGEFDLSWFHAAGSCEEFAPQQARLDGPRRLESVSGRSSHGDHPWFVLRAVDGRHVVVAVAWSGNWIARLDPLGDGRFRMSIGLHDRGFSKVLQPGDSVSAAPVVLAFGADALTDTSAALADVGRRNWYPPVDGRFPPTEWNHWWPYIDRNIDERTFLANVDAAAGLGLELCTLDAGWYGSPEVGAEWYAHRGDWDVVNSARFPRGLRALADHVHRRGLMFGLWCEIEAVGSNASLPDKRPDLPATRAGEPLGYVCFGNPAARTWALETLERLVTDYGCDWLKLDFNVDPGLGCDRTDHGHSDGDGLYEHYAGYYRMLDEMRSRHPRVILENCSSGGLRLDLGIARHTHISYISDPDWPEHSLQSYWGAVGALAPDRCLHWAYSQWWKPNAHPRQRFDPHDPDLTARRLDYYVRISMLHAFGLSQKLPELPSWVADRYRAHIALYKDVVRRFVREADALALTGQPLRDGKGERWAAFQYAMPDNRDHLLFVFRLDGSSAEPNRTIRLRRLRPDGVYAVCDLASGAEFRRAGAELTREGLLFDDLWEEDSALLRISDDGPA